MFAAWYIACRSKELGRRPIARTIINLPIVLFRNEVGKAAALLDRCAHRNAPLSKGRTVGSQIECPYHGWQYDTEGACRLIPSFCESLEGKTFHLPTFPVIEQQGFVWVYPMADQKPEGSPLKFPLMNEVGYSSIIFQASFEASLQLSLENMLDVPHTAFLHRGLFRGEKRTEITARIRHSEDRVEAEYLNEPRPQGIAGWLASPQGGTVSHTDRFILPTTAQVEYKYGKSGIL